MKWNVKWNMNNVGECRQLCARERLEITSSKVQAILVAHQIDEDVRTFCEQYGITAITIPPERITRSSKGTK